MTCAVVLWVLLGTPAGYVSSRLYKSKPPTVLLGIVLARFLLVFSPIVAVCLRSVRRGEVEDQRPLDGPALPGVGGGSSCLIARILVGY